MATLNVFLAPDGPAGGVLDVLTDLSAAGLVDPFLWVVDSDVPSDPQVVDVEAVKVDGGVRTPATVSAELADSSYSRRRLCVVAPLGGPEPVVTMEVEQRLLTLVSFRGGGAAVTPIRALLARPGDRADPGQLDHAGWHNIYVAPEDARGPGEARQLLGAPLDPVDVGRCAAPAIAGIVGIWTGNDRSPLDDVQAPSGVRAGRAFYRRIDASEVERELRSRVLSTRAPLPAPRDHTATAVYLDDTATACRDMANTWWARHREALIGPRVRPRPVPPLPKGAWALLKMFFEYLWTRLRNAPEDFLRKWRVQVLSGTARAVHSAVLGAGDSAYEVVVHGVSGRGLPAGWRELGAASGALDDRLVATGRFGPHAQRPDLRRMWEEYAFGAMTLADAGRHGAIEPLRVDANPGVLRSADDIAPPPHRDFVDIPGYLHSELGDRRVVTGDVLGAESMRWKLEAIGQDRNRAADVGRTLAALGAWRAAHQHTYSVQVGSHIATNLLDTIREIRGYLDWLARMAAEEADRPLAPPHRFAVWMTRILGVLALAGVIAAPILLARDVIRIPAAILIGVGLPVLWLGFVLYGFLRQGREAFRELHRQREIASEVEAVQANLRQATIDVRRLGDAYDQYLVWSVVIGCVLHDPFGPAPRSGGAGTVITHGLPRTTRIARAQVDENITGFAAAALRADIFGTGWLGRLWVEHLKGAGRQLNRHDLVDDRWEGILDLRGGVADSPLRQWGERLAGGGVSSASGSRVWAEVMASLRGNRRNIAESLLSSVQGVERGDQRSYGLAEFLTGVDQPASAGQEFDPAHFTSRARSGELAAVDVHVPMQAQVGLSRIDVLVQLTAASPPWSFAVTEQAPGPAGPAPSLPNYPGPAGREGSGPDAGGPEPQWYGPDLTAVPQAPKGFQ